SCVPLLQPDPQNPRPRSVRYTPRSHQPWLINRGRGLKMKEKDRLTPTAAIGALLTSVLLVGGAFVGLQAVRGLASCGQLTPQECRNGQGGPPAANPGLGRGNAAAPQYAPPPGLTNNPALPQPALIPGFAGVPPSPPI